MPKMGATTKTTSKPTTDADADAGITTNAPDAPVTNDWFTELSDSQEYVKIVYYGREGTGKTTAAAQASQNGRILIVNSEGGLKKTALKRHGVDVTQVAVWPPEGESITARRLEALHAQLLADLTDNPDAWYAVVIDSLTEVHHLLREQATDARVAKSRVELDPDFIDRDDYGKMTAQMRKIVRRFRDLPCHVILIALEKDDEDAKEVRPALTPALCTDVLGYADVVARMGSADGSFRARFIKTDRIRAKDRFDVLPEVLPEPGFDRVRQYIAEELVTADDPLLAAMLDQDRAVAAEKAAAEDEKKARRTAAKRAPRKAAPKKASGTAEESTENNTETKED